MSDDQIAFQGLDAAWIIWAALWVVMALSAKKTVRHESAISRALHLGPLLLGALLLFDSKFAPRFLSGPVTPRADWMAPAGAVLVVAGLAFSAWARFVIGANWSGSVTVKQEHALVDTGPYALARHPIYTGLIVALAGTAIAEDNWRAVTALVIIAVSFLRKMRTEERFMTETFGERYQQYKKRTAALVPFVW